RYHSGHQRPARLLARMGCVRLSGMAGVVGRLGAILRAPLRAAGLLAHGERQLSELREIARKTRKATADIGSSIRRTDAHVEKQAERIASLEQELDALRRDLSGHLQR